MKKLITLLLTIVSFASVHATIRYVRQVATGNGSGDGWANASNDIQAMINASTDGDEIWVCAGNYKPNRPADNLGTLSPGNRSNAFVLKKNVKIYGGFSGVESTLSGRNLADSTQASTLDVDFNDDDAGGPASYVENGLHVVVSAGDVGLATLDGFTIRGGYAETRGGIQVNGQAVSTELGAGIVCVSSSPILSNLKIKQNIANYGGGMGNATASPMVNNCLIAENIGIFMGGGISNIGSSAPRFTGCTIIRNAAQQAGGGIYHTTGGKLTLINNVIQENYANIGGGLRMLDGDPDFTAIGNTFYWNNAASNDGGALSLVMGAGKDTIINNQFIRNMATTTEREPAGNGGGAIVQEGGSSSFIVNNTFYNNQAAANSGAIRFKSGGSNRYLYNNIFYKNVVGTSENDVSLEAGTAITGQSNNSYSNTYPVFANQLDAEGPDKIFGTADDGLRLLSCSHLIDGGINTALPSGITTDIAGRTRIYNGTVDMGAFEFNGDTSSTITAGVVCPGSTGNIASVPNAGAGATYAWDITNGIITSANNGDSIVYTSGNSGVVTLSVVITVPGSNCAAITGTRQVTISSSVVTITSAGYVCSQSVGNNASVPNAGAGASYAWTIANGTITSAADSSSIEYSANASGNITLTVAVTTRSGCPSNGTAQVLVDAKPPYPNILADDFVCPGTTGHLATVEHKGTGMSYEWNVANGEITSANNLPNITYNAGSRGDVYLTVTIGKCGLYTTGNTAQVRISNLADTIIQANSLVCTGSTGNEAFVFETAGANYRWTIENGTITAGLNTPRITYTAGASGAVSLALLSVNADLCPSSATAVRAINAPAPIQISTPNTLICGGSTANTASVPDAGYGGTYAWTLSNGTITSGRNDREIQFNIGRPGTATLAVATTATGACPAFGTVVITVDDGGQWARKANSPMARSNAFGFGLNGKGYVALGTDGDGERSSDVWEYDRDGNQWAQKASFPGYGQVATCFAMGRLAYFGPTYDDGYCFRTFNAGTNTWGKKTLDRLPFSSGMDMKTFVINGKVYFYVYSLTAGAPAPSFWEWDPNNDYYWQAWTQKASFPGALRGEASAFGGFDRGYLGLGRNGQDVYSDFWEYNPASDSWTRKADFGDGGRYGAVGFDGFISTGSGADGSAKKDLWEYDSYSNTWNRKADFDGPARKAAIGFQIAGNAYIGAGNDGDMKTDLWEFDPFVWRIATGKVKPQICGGETFALSYSLGCKQFTPNNVFTAQLSDANGSFNNPVAIGSLAGIYNGAINVRVPAVTGARYRMRVVSSSPQKIGSDNGTDIRINYVQAGFTVSPSNVVCGATVITLSATGTNTYSWSGGINNNVPFVASQTASYTVTGTDENGCTDTAVATITVNALPQGSLAGSSICSGEIGQFTFTSQSGNPPFLLRIKDTVYNGVRNGVPFNVWVNPANTTAYRLLSVTDSNGCVRTDGFTNAEAIISKVNSRLAIDKDVATVYLQSAKEILAVDGAICRMMAEITPSGNNPVAGNLVAKVWVDSTVQSQVYNGYALPYVQRHYDIAPDNNADAATAQLTLYFSQAEFDRFNEKVSSASFSLPTGPNDVQGKNRLRVYQFHGASNSGTGTPDSYPGDMAVINPGEAAVAWNTGSQRWEVSFEVNGFSGFFLGVNLVGALPVKLVSFSGALSSGNKAANLQWEVVSQQGIQSYVVEKSADGNSFQRIGSVAANQLASSTYTYSDLLPPASSLLTVYYRLKIVDANGQTTYSHIVRLAPASALAAKIMLYPNPVAKGGVLQISVANSVLRRYTLTTAAGHVLLKKDGLRAMGNTSLLLPATLAVGVYYLQVQTDAGISNEQVIVR